MDLQVFRCPGCQQPFQVRAQQAGQMVRCPSCEDAVQIPPAATAPSVIPTTEEPRTNKTNADKTNADKSKASQTKASQSKVNKSKANQTGSHAPNAVNNAEAVQPYDCPHCQKAFGIYRSMIGSQMVCPHCQKTVLLRSPVSQSTGDPSVAADPPPVGPQTSTPNRQSKVPLKNQPDIQPTVETPAAPATAKESKFTKPSKAKVTKVDPSAVPTETKTPAKVPDAVASPPKPAEHRSPESTTEATVEATAEPSAEPSATVFQPQPVDHLLPPKFQAVDPSFFYRRHQDGSQVLLPGEDGKAQVVDNRIVRIEHNGQTYELVSSPRYDRIQKTIVTNLLAVIICGLVIAIVMTLLKG